MVCFRVAATFTVPDFSDNTNISLCPFGDELYAFNETRMLHKINIQNLATEKKEHLNNYVGILHNSSHPLVLEDGKCKQRVVSIVVKIKNSEALMLLLFSDK